MNKWLKLARQFYNVAIRRKLVTENPFVHCKAAVKGDPSRRVFVPADVIEKVIEVLPNAEWRLLVALARWGGLRIPSEVVTLTWADVDIPGRRFIVRSSKTEHHEGGGIRVVPMFPELVQHFEEAYELAEEGATHVFPNLREADNLRTTFVRYIAKAGCKPWPKPFQNLRASRATDLADLYPSHVSAAWLGHTEQIADAFYRQVTDEHFARAIGGTKRNAEYDAFATQNPTQQVSARKSREVQETTQALENQGLVPNCASSDDTPPQYILPPRGVEPLFSD